MFISACNADYHLNKHLFNNFVLPFHKLTNFCDSIQLMIIKLILIRIRLVIIMFNYDTKVNVIYKACYIFLKSSKVVIYIRDRMTWLVYHFKFMFQFNHRYYIYGSIQNGMLLQVIFKQKLYFGKLMKAGRVNSQTEAAMLKK